MESDRYQTKHYALALCLFFCHNDRKRLVIELEENVVCGRVNKE